MKGSRLARTLSAGGVLALTLSAVSPAASIYISGSGILRMAGTGAVWAVSLGSLIAILAALLIAELVAAYPDAGGVYVGITGVLGRGPGRVAAVLGLVIAPAALALSASGLADYIQVLTPAVPKLAITSSALGSAVLLAALAIRTNAWVTGVFLAVELIAVLIVAVVALSHPLRGVGEMLVHPTMLGPGGRLVRTPLWTIALATLSGAYACAGSGMAVYFSEDLRGDPARIGRIVVSSGVMAALVISAPLVAITAAAPHLASTLSAQAPISRTLQELSGPRMAAAVALAVALAIFNNVVATSLAFSRFVYATGRDGLWPAPVSVWLSSLEGPGRSTWPAALAVAVLSAALCLLPERSLLVLLSGDVFTTTLVAVAVLVGRRRGLTGAATYRSPLFPAVPLSGLIFAAVILMVDWRDRAAGRPSLFVLTTIVGITILTSWLHRRRKERSSL